MSQAGSEKDWNIYTALAFVSCSALLIACVLLYQELQKYGFSG